MLLDLEQFQWLVGGLDHPECVAWGLDGNFYAGGEAGQIYRVGLDGSRQEIASTRGFILGLCLDGRSNVYACDVGNHAVMKVTPAGAVSVYSPGWPERPMNAPNGIVFDRHGYLYVTDSGERNRANGVLWRIAPDGKTEMVSTTLRENPNGLAIDPTGQYLYVVLSDTSSIMRARLPIEPDGPLGEPEPVVQLEQAIPDGMAFDVESNLYIGCDAPNAIFRVPPGGRAEVLAEDWSRATLAAPTNMAFGGPDWRTLAVANFARWGLVHARMDVPGMRLNYPFGA